MNDETRKRMQSECPIIKPEFLEMTFSHGRIVVGNTSIVFGRSVVMREQPRRKSFELRKRVMTSCING